MESIKFLEECKKNGITLMPPDESMIKGLFKQNGQLRKSLGDEFEKATFYELCCQIGDRIPGINDWLDEKERAEQKKKENLQKPEKVDASAADDDRAAKEPAHGAPAREELTASKEADPESGADENAANSEPVQEKQPKKPKKPSYEFNSYFSSGSTPRTRYSEKEKEIRRKISNLEREKEIINRPIAIGRRDYEALLAISQYGRGTGTSIEVNGNEAGGNIAQAIHAAVSLLVKELSGQGDEKLLKKLEESQAKVTEDIKELDDKIEELKNELIRSR